MEVRRLSRSGLALLVGACVLTQGCGTTPQDGYGTAAPSAACERIATLRLAGERRVYLNNRPASDGAPLCNGDRVSTGAASSAYILFARGGLVQLDQNTDPIFQVLQELVIEVFGLNDGQMYAESPPGGKIIVRSPNGNLETSGTSFNLRVSPFQSLLTVLHGRVQLMLPGVGLLEPNEQVGFKNGVVEFRRTLSLAEIGAVVQWRDRYPLRAPDSGEKPADTSAKSGVASAIPAILGAIIGAVIVNKALEDEEDKGSQVGGTGDGHEPSTGSTAPTPGTGSAGTGAVGTGVVGIRPPKCPSGCQIEQNCPPGCVP